MKATMIVLLFALGIALVGCVNAESVEPEEKGPDVTEPVEQEKEVEEAVLSPAQVANEVVLVLKGKDMRSLAQYVHPTKGVRFSPYAYVDVENHKVFSAEQVEGLLNDTTVYTWGSFDGSGNPLEMTFADYMKRFVYDEDYANAEQVAVNERLGQGNSIDNTSEVFAKATVVEYHFPGFDEQYEGMDWRSLRIVLEKKADGWYLVGIIHDEWTS